MDSLKKIEYRIKAGIESAVIEKEKRINDRIKLPLRGIHKESIYITGVKELLKKCDELYALYDKVPESMRVSSVILLDAHASATIEGAYTTVERMKKCLQKPETKDEIMVTNTYSAGMYAYNNQITKENVRLLWEKIVDGVCENQDKAGELYRSGMVNVGNETRTIHIPAKETDIEMFMDDLFSFIEGYKLDKVLKSFVFHFYFVYIHPFCDGNGRTARTINNSQLFFSGLDKIKSIAIASAINGNLNNYYKSITDSEDVIDSNMKEKWLDISPFLSYMLDVLEQAMVNAMLADNELNVLEKKVLDRMNRTGIKAEITVKNAMKITGTSESSTRKLLNTLANKGYLYINKDSKTYVYVLVNHMLV